MTFLKWNHSIAETESWRWSSLAQYVLTEGTDGQYTHYSLSKHYPSKYESHERKDAWGDNYSNTPIIIIIITDETRYPIGSWALQLP